MRIIKIGGNVIDIESRLNTVLDACASFNEPFVLVHGGGNIATEIAEQLGVPQTMVDGRRITDAATLRILTMVLAGLVNKTIVSALQARGVNAIGLTGADGNLSRATQRGTGGGTASGVDKETPRELSGSVVSRTSVRTDIDYGFVGDIDHVNTALLRSLIDSGMCPVCAPLSHDGNGLMLNTNADDVARVLAVALAANTANNIELIYVFDHAGVLRDINDPTSAFASLNRSNATQLHSDGIITKGMLPKLENAFLAAESGVQCVRITRYDSLNEGTLIHA